MPLEFVDLERGRKALGPGDRGFLITLAKSRWNNQAGSEALKLLKSFAKQYYEEKGQDSEPAVPGEDANDTEATQTTVADDSKKEAAGSSEIQFVIRDVMFGDCCFIATNLADPSDYACYIMNQLVDVKKHAKTKFPIRIMPVYAVCEARPKNVEKAVYPFIERTFGADEEPYRFSLMYRGHKDCDNLNQFEARNILRNCVWAANPNCVQCIKYQDYAILMDILAPLFVFGLAKDFQRLVGYNTWSIRNGMDLKDQGEDSEDEISDDPDLDEEAEKRRKLKVKRKRRAQRAGAEQAEDDEKRYPDLDPEEEDEQDDEAHKEEDHKEDFEMQQENGVENEAGDA